MPLTPAVAAHGAELLIVGGEADGLSEFRDQQQIVFFTAKCGADEAIVLVQVDGDEATGTC